MSGSYNPIQFFESMDKYPTSAGEITLRPIGHGSVMIGWHDKVIQVDPYGEIADYGKLPRADMILITHDHYDHYDPPAIEATRKADTVLIGKFPADTPIENRIPLDNGQHTQWEGMDIQAVPAYNRLHMRAPGEPFHPKGFGNGYILTAGELKIYIAGDTELIPEMKELGKIDIAFLPQNLPYTMDFPMFIEAAKLIRPRVLYPYHYGEIDREAVAEALPGIEVRWK